MHIALRALHKAQQFPIQCLYSQNSCRLISCICSVCADCTYRSVMCKLVCSIVSASNSPLDPTSSSRYALTTSHELILIYVILTNVILFCICLQCSGISNEEREWFLDLRPFAYHSPLVFDCGASCLHLQHVFRHLGCHEVLVTNRPQHACGFISKKVPPPPPPSLPCRGVSDLIFYEFGADRILSCQIDIECKRLMIAWLSAMT